MQIEHSSQFVKARQPRRVVVYLMQNLSLRGRQPPIIFARIVRPYNFAIDSFHTKKLCSRLSSSEVRFYKENGRFACLSPPLGDLGATYADRLGLIGKGVVLIKLFFSRCYGWGATSEYRLIVGDFAPTGAVWPKISGIRGRPSPTILLLRELG